jgi:hypothetical protein
MAEPVRTRKPDWSCTSQVLDGALKGVPLGLAWGAIVGVHRVWGSHLSDTAHVDNSVRDCTNAAWGKALDWRHLWQFRVPRPFAYPSHLYMSMIFVSAIGRAAEFGVFTAQYYGIYCFLDRQSAIWTDKILDHSSGHVFEKLSTVEQLRNPRLIAAAAGTASGISTLWMKWLFIALRNRLALHSSSSGAQLRPGSAGYFLAASAVVGTVSAAVCFTVEMLRE